MSPVLALALFRAKMIMDYSSTLNLPKTDFPMKAGLPRKEPQTIEFWDKMSLYNKMREARSGAHKYVLHDGPPYANGSIHMGTALNKVLKDIINKYRFMQGFDIPFVPGWDTHGLPIEHQVIKNMKVKREETGDLDFRRTCGNYARHYLGVQRGQFQRLGVVADWENPYTTMDYSFEARQVEIFGQMAHKGYIYKGKKPVFWCSQCETALAEAEVEYYEKRSPSIYVKFPVTNSGGRWEREWSPAYVIIWTTTPWTIPANLAIAVHPQHTYYLVEVEKEYYLLAANLVEEVLDVIGRKKGAVLRQFKGSDLEGVVCSHPIYGRESVVLSAEYVTLDQGTGCVHIAPGHGQEDYETGRRYDLPVYAPLDGKGVFTPEAGEFAGLRFDEGNKAVTSALDRENALLDLSFVTHQYPHCWRCKKEVIFRATEQWFASIQHFRDEALKAVRKVKWMPAWGEARMAGMIAGRGDWCISRQRVWGVPIPVFYCSGCGESLLTGESIAAVAELFRREGSDAWFIYNAAEILPAHTRCPSCGQGNFTKEQDIMDVWFDSGSSHEAVLKQREEMHWPADLYLEGSDQFRGWFQSSLLTSVSTTGEPPYRSVLSHGWVVDGEGRKMSKSLGNVIVPEDIIDNYGADILRLWVSSADITTDVHLSRDILKQLTEVYRKIRNTCRFLLGNCSDFEPSRDAVAYSELEEIDRWALHRLYRLVQRTARAYKNYEFHQVFHSLHNFAVVDMSNFYLDIIKDRLYILPQGSISRRGAQTVMAEILRTLTLLTAPVLSFTAEEIWSYITFRKEESVMLASWPELPAYYEDEALEARWESILQLKEEVNRILEQKRREKVIGNSLQASVELYPDKELHQKLLPYEPVLAAVLIVSETILHGPDVRPGEDCEQANEMNLHIKVQRARGEKCQRCWVYCTTTGHVEEYPEVCSRCMEILKEWKDKVV